jgi:hypothetical protein
MGKLQPEKQQTSGRGAVTDGVTRRVIKSVPRSVSQSGEPGLVELCPICVFLLDSEEGQVLFENNMIADVHMERGVISSVGWHCRMCGASGEGQIPEFHEKPRRQIR